MSSVSIFLCGWRRSVGIAGLERGVFREGSNRAAGPRARQREMVCEVHLCRQCV